MFCSSRLYNRFSTQKIPEINLLLIRIIPSTKGKNLPTCSTGRFFFNGGAVLSSLAHFPLDLVVWVQALAGDNVISSWARHCTLTVHLSTEVYRWELPNLMQGVTLWSTSIPSRGEVGIPLVFPCYKNQRWVSACWPLGWNVRHCHFYLFLYCMFIMMVCIIFSFSVKTWSWRQWCWRS